MAVVTDRGHGREGPVMDGVVTDRGLAGLTTDVVVHLMDQDPHEKALDYSVSDPEKHRVNESNTPSSITSSNTCTTWTGIPLR